MRLSVQKSTNYPKELSYAVLAQGAATGVWSDEEWHGSRKSERASLTASMQEAAKKSKR